ncbi:SWIM zinc finger family protein [Aquabacterium sp.]|uniref:SWIM zinc finger family protein n=1 Tax=Aquabacterium sp. TaxID=1872578 RepID=UPI002CD86BBE|nr:SWIM zinc finger family protein [Aquabacterium sp.]HSW08635.1 SWIM zinc finger family protein [Aquabacterium sp.]
MARNDYYDGWAPYVPVAQRRQQAQQKAAALKKKGHECQSVAIEGRTIAKSFWGKAWCDNLESYSDYANRLPRGRTYVRNGSVIDLCIETGRVQALVSGSAVYRVEIGVQALPAPHWEAIVRTCSGQVASLIELLQGRLSSAVMETVTRRGEGLFPLPQHISLSCSCPDSASMCKHVAAVLYGVGNRLDKEPALLFQLRHVDPLALTRQVGQLPALASADAREALDGTDLSALFGIDLVDDGLAAANPPAPPDAAPARQKPPSRRAREAQAVELQPAPGPALRPALSGATAKTQPLAPSGQPRGKTVTAADLIARGVARHMIPGWIASGVLLRTEQRGVYRTSAQTEARIRAYVATRWAVGLP